LRRKTQVRADRDSLRPALAACPEFDLPDETLVEVLRSLELCELLGCAWTCKRWFSVAQDTSLWKRTRFSSCEADLLLRHFRPHMHSRHSDHTGIWTKCTRIIGQVPLVCRSVELDYVDRGEGVCYRLLRSVSCLQQLHHDNILPLLIINLDASTNRLTLFYADAGVPLERILHVGKLPLYQAKDILRQVLRALAHCHCQGITHRNLKPKYIMLRDTNRGTEEAPLYDVRLSDFNSVRWLGVQRLVGQQALYGATHVSGACSPTVVTQPYRAPEILLGWYVTSVCRNLGW
jgi:serine/threonine protein kinase